MLALVGGCAAESESTSGTAATASPKQGATAAAKPNVSKAKAALAALPVAEPETMTGYSREKFPHWKSAGPNCDVRDSVLIRDGEDVTKDGCNVTGGRWKSWYDDQTNTELSKVDIDHMVPLANAWRSGAAAWTTEQRGQFANDMERPQLFAVSASSNRSKGDQSPDQWKPPSRGAWCLYAQDWITVKTYWKLAITAPEKAALGDMLATCA